MNTAFPYRLYPNPEQEILIHKTLGCVRFIYNRMLANRQAIYAPCQDDKEASEKQKYVLPADLKKECAWLKDVASLALANAQRNVQTAYRNFFRDPSVGFPQFKSQHHDKKSLTTNNQGGTMRLIDSQTFRLPKLKDVRIKRHRPLSKNAVIKSATISQTPRGNCDVSVLVECAASIQPVEPTTETVLGLDYSSPSLYVDSEGTPANYPQCYRQAEAQLKKAQRQLSHRKKGGQNREKQRLTVAKLHEKVANPRQDFWPKLSRQIANTYIAGAREDLNMRGMAQQRFHMGKSTHDNEFGMFKAFLAYRLAEPGKPLVVIDKWFPSRKRCRFCQHENKELTWADRVGVCPHGGAELDRDENAAIHTQNEGCRMLDLA